MDHAYSAENLMTVRKVSVVVPVYNEAENLEQLFHELIAQAKSLPEVDFEFIFVDDGSKDGSLLVMNRLAAADRRLKLIIFGRNSGQTSAMSCGIKHATGDVIIPMDADLQNDPADIPKFLQKINEGFSCVSGWRKDRKDALLTRKIPSWTANAIISWMTGVRLHDYGCSMKAYLRTIIQDVELYGEMHRFIPAYAAWQGAKVVEIVVNHRARIHGVSKYGISRVFKVILDLIVVKFLVKYFNRPMHFFGAIGFVSLAIGLLAEGWAVYYKVIGFASFIQTPLPIVGTMFIIVACQFILFGLVAEVLMRTYYESQRRTPYSIRQKINFE